MNLFKRIVASICIGLMGEVVCLQTVQAMKPGGGEDGEQPSVRFKPALPELPCQESQADASGAAALEQSQMSFAPRASAALPNPSSSEAIQSSVNSEGSSAASSVSSSQSAQTSLREFSALPSRATHSSREVQPDGAAAASLTSGQESSTLAPNLQQSSPASISAEPSAEPMSETSATRTSGKLRPVFLHRAPQSMRKALSNEAVASSGSQLVVIQEAVPSQEIEMQGLGTPLPALSPRSAQSSESPRSDEPLEEKTVDRSLESPTLSQDRSPPLSPVSAFEVESLEDKGTENLQETFESLKKIEQQSWPPRWADVDRMPNPLMHLVTTGKWFKGHGDPTDDLSILRRIYFNEGFIQGAGFILERGVDLLITALTIAQLTQTNSASDFFNTFFLNGDEYALTSLLYQSSASVAWQKVLYASFALPAVWGLIKGIRMCSNAHEDPEEAFEKLKLDLIKAGQSPLESWEIFPYFIGKHCPEESCLSSKMKCESERCGFLCGIKRYSAGLWSDGLRWLSIPHPLDGILEELMEFIRWDKRLTFQKRDDSLTALFNCFEVRGGYTRIVVGWHIAQFINSVGPGERSPSFTISSGEAALEGVELGVRSSMAHVSTTAASATVGDIESTLGHDEQVDPGSYNPNPHDIRIKALKIRALEKIQKLATFPDEEWKEAWLGKKIFSLFPLFLYGRYLKWWLGLAPTKKESIAFWTFKLGKSAFNFLIIKSVYEAIKEYLDCPQKKGVAFTGEASYAGKFDKTCFDATVAQFNLLPGQPVSTLTDTISEFYLPGGTYALDLSNKALNGTAIRDVIQGFVNSGITLTSLDVSGNQIGLNDDVDPGDTIAFANMLETLTSITSLYLSGNSIGYHDDINTDGTIAIGQAIGGLKLLRKLDLSNQNSQDVFNGIGAHDDINPTGTIAIGQGIGQLNSLNVLSLSGNQIGGKDNTNITGTVSIGQEIGHLIQLTSLDLSSNLIGSSDSTNPTGTIAIGQGIGLLPVLTYLNLSTNLIGTSDYINPTGTMAIGQGIGNLTTLISLDLSSNQIGSCDPTQESCSSANTSGTIAIGNGIGQLPSLTYLSLSSNKIGFVDYIDPTGTIAIGQGIGNLKILKVLDLSLQGDVGGGGIGAYDANNTAGTIAIGEGVGRLRSLTSINLSWNNIGNGDAANSNGTMALGQGIGNLTTLTSLDLSHNDIGVSGDTYLDGITALNQGFSSLSALQQLTLFPNPVTSNIWTLFKNTISTLPNSPTLPDLLIIPDDVDDYFATKPLNQTSFNFSGLLVLSDASSTAMLTRLMATLSQFPVTSLSLANNNIGNTDDTNANGTIAIGQGIGNLTSLASLSLVNNWIGWHDDINPAGTIAIGQGIGSLPSLTYLSISSNFIGSSDYQDTAGTMAIGQGICNFGALRALDLSQNWIGSSDASDTAGTIAIGQGIGQLTQLTSLNLSINDIGSYDYSTTAGTMGIGQGIGLLKALKSLDLSGNVFIGSNDNTNPNGTVTIGQGIGQLPVLTYLSLSNNEIGSGDATYPDGTVAIGQGIGNLTALRILDLSVNSIGSQSAIGEFAILSGLQGLENLCSLNLAGNQIGSTDQEGPALLLNFLPRIPIFNIKGMQNISWTQSANSISTITANTLQSACESNLCLGTSIPPTNQAVCSVPSSSSFLSTGSTNSFTSQSLDYPSTFTSAAFKPQTLGRNASLLSDDVLPNAPSKTSHSSWSYDTGDLLMRGVVVVFLIYFFTKTLKSIKRTLTHK